MTSPNADPRTPGSDAVPRRLSDRAVLVWGALWTATTLIVLGCLWIGSLPLGEPLWALVVFVSILASSAATAPISRFDVTLVVSVAPAMLLIAVASTGWPEALAIWGTAYFFGTLIRLRNLGDAAEMTAYLLGCALVSVGALELLRGAGAPWTLAASVFIVVYLAVRLVISSARLAVITHLGFREALGGLLLVRIAIAWFGIWTLSIGGLATQQLIDEHRPVIGAYWGGALVILAIGAATFAIGVYREPRVVSAQLSGTLAAANELPWAPEIDISEHARRFASLALPRYSITVEPQAGRNVNEIVSPLSEGFLVARRGTSQPPFLVRDQRVLDAIAHIAVTMTDARNERERLARSAITDELTGLPNYRGFRDALARLAQSADDGFAVVYIDVDRFKEVNDRYGHETGNAVLRAFARRLASRCSPSEVVARLGGDEFALILAGLADGAAARRRASAILEEVSAPVVVGGAVITLSLSSGVAFSSPGEADPSGLVEVADARMYAARGRQVLDSTGEIPSLSPAGDVLDVVETIARAIRERRLSVRYQPVVDAIEDRIVGFEALIRPDEPALEGLPAAVIVHEAKRLGLLTELSAHVMQLAVRDALRFQRLRPELREMNVNIDVEQVVDPAFIAAMERVDGAGSVRLTLELSESSLNRSSEEVTRELDRIRASGVLIALDDFGRDASTLLSILQYPLDVLKIDRALTRGMEHRKPQEVMRSMAALAANLDVKMVVEGVEDEATCAMLMRSGVRFMQGYRFGAAMTPEAVLERLAAHGLSARLP